MFESVFPSAIFTDGYFGVHLQKEENKQLRN